MAKPPSPNAHKPWMDDETRVLRRLARAGVPRREIASELGRSPDAIANYASKIGVKLEPPSQTPAAPQAAVPPPAVSKDSSKPAGSDAIRSSAEGKPPNQIRLLALGGNGAEPDFRLKVVRLARSTRPWIWEIRRDGEASARKCSTMGYRSAEDAWVAGKAALADYRHRDGP